MAPVGDGSGLSAAAEPSSPPRLVSVHTSGGADLATPTKSKSRDGDGSDADEGLTPATSPTSSNNTNGDAHTISSTSSDSGAAVGSLALPAGALNDGGVRAMDVTVTVLSLHGIIAQSSKKKESKKRSKRSKAGSKSQANPTATIVASFSQPIGKDRVFLTHVPSSPVSLQNAAPTSAGGLKKASSNASTISSNASMSSAGSTSNTGHHESSANIHKPAVHWPTLVDVDELDSDDGMSPTAALSTLQFQRQFVREGRGRYVPQTCPITLSVSRNGKMALLGRANLVVNGEEAGEASATVPISSSVRGNRSVKKKMGLGKKKGEMATVKVSKGDAFQFGLEAGAMLRVLVNVSDPEKKKKKKSKERKEAAPAAASGDEMEAMSRVSTGHDVADDTLASISECRGRNEDEEQLSLEGLSVEGLDDDDASLEQDDYYAQMQRHMMENTEVRSLRQQLANTEHTNKVLQMELANARQEATLALDNERECEEENDRLREELVEARRESDQSKAELERARANRSTLKEDLATVQTESELLPIYETRVSELLEELKRRDLEVQCLRDEIGELRGHYKDQLADSLLWDNDDGTERKPILPEALRKLTAFRREEGRCPEDLLWDKDDEVETPKGDEKDAVGAAADDLNGEEGEETRAPAIASSATSGTTPNVDNFASILQGAKPIKEDSIQEEEETPESPIDGEEVDTTNDEGEGSADDASPKKGGWGVHRRIGAGIMGLEERMRLRQQQFREQQQKLEQNAGDSSPDLKTPAMQNGAADAEVTDEEEETAQPDDATELGQETPTHNEVETTCAPEGELEEEASNAEEGTELQEEGEGEAETVQDDNDTEDSALTELSSDAKGDSTSNDQGESKAETKSDDSEAADGSSPKKGGWGVHRKIGAGIMGLEEKMRLRQQKFREQQEKIEQQKLAEQQAEPKEPGLGGVIISRISSHGDAGKQPADEEDKGEDENVEEKEKGAEHDDEAKEGDCAETDDTLSPEDSTNDEAKQNEEDKLIFRKSSYNQVLLAESIDELERAVLSDHPSSSAAPSSTQDGDDSSQADADSEAGDEQSAEKEGDDENEDEQVAADDKDPSFIGTVKSNDEAEADNEFDEFIRVCSSDALDG
ncbi:hypothetical protein ACHAXT_006526 [Thalassiosira profunda]